MNILKWQKFLEANLDLEELKKTSNSGTRGDILVKKIKNREELKTSDGETIKVDKMKSGERWINSNLAVKNITDPTGNYDSEKAKSYFTKPRGSRYNYVEVIMDEDGNELKLNQLLKTSDFGSRGPGVLTRKFESIQCLFLGIKQGQPESNLTSLNLKDAYLNYIKYQNLVFLPEKIKADEELIEKFLEDPDWVNTFSKIPNRLWSDRYVNTQDLYAIFHASYIGEDSPSTHIEKKYRELAKEGGFSDINFSKYCPADVFMSSLLSNKENIKKIDQCKSIGEMTDLLNNLFDTKQLISLSLKKIHERFKIITNSESEKQLPEFFIKTYHIGSDDLKGIGSKISTTSIWKHRNNKDVDKIDRKINFDSSDTSKNVNVDGEIEGSTSRHGKISFNSIKRILDSSGIKGLYRLQTHEELRQLTVDQLKAMVQSLVKKCKDWKPELEKKSHKDKVITVDVSPVLRGRDISNSENKLISRIQSLQILLCIMQIHLKNEEMAQKIITKILRYALSIQTDRFDTPRYLRII